jgi:hypothetical protein
MVTWWLLLRDNELWRFHSDVTVLLRNNGLLQQHNTRRKHCYGYRSVIDKREFWSKLGSCVLGSEEKGRFRVGSTICLCILTVRIRVVLEELWTVINSCVLSLDCNKLPLWNRTCELITIYFDRDFAWLKYFIYRLVLLLAQNYKQHILSLAEVIKVCYSLAELYVKCVYLNLFMWRGARCLWNILKRGASYESFRTSV